MQMRLHNCRTTVVIGRSEIRRRSFGVARVDSKLFRRFNCVHELANCRVNSFLQRIVPVSNQAWNYDSLIDRSDKSLDAPLFSGSFAGHFSPDYFSASLASSWPIRLCGLLYRHWQSASMAAHKATNWRQV